MHRHELPDAFEILEKVAATLEPATAESVYRKYHDPFKVLVSTILSSRTRDETTFAAGERLFSRAKDMAELDNLDVDTIIECIYPVGFYRTKAYHLSTLSAMLKKEFNNIIPDTVEGLLRLPGVGRKTANLVVSVAFNKPAVCVDTHVHRITNRWGLIHTEKPYYTELKLRASVPQKYWSAINRYLVPFGKHICLPRIPRCSGCGLHHLCEYGNSFQSRM